MDRSKLLPQDEILGIQQYAHNVGGFVVRPEDMGRIKGNAVKAMEEQVNEQLEQIRGQVATLAQQAHELKKRAEISFEIYGAEMRFEPVIGKTYFLYEKQTHSPEKFLSPIAPHEWLHEAKPSFVASVKLLADHTWKIISSNDPSRAEKKLN